VLRDYLVVEPDWLWSLVDEPAVPPVLPDPLLPGLLPIPDPGVSDVDVPEVDLPLASAG
jgi:hypothetical protein